MKKTAQILVALFSLLSFSGIFAGDNDLIKVRNLDDILKETAKEKEKITDKEKRKRLPEDLEKEIDKDKNGKKEKAKEADLNKDKETKRKVVYATKFNGVITRYDLFLEKKVDHYYLWIRAKGLIRSVALISYSPNSKRRYYLRSEKPMGQLDSRIYYKRRLIGGKKSKSNFICESKPLKHPLLGKAYLLILPKAVVSGYKSRRRSSYRKHSIYEGKTWFIVRAFDRKNARGAYVDNPYKIESLRAEPVESAGLKLMNQKKEDNLYGFEFEYTSPTLNVKEIQLAVGNDLYPIAVFPKKGMDLPSDKAIIIQYWSYNHNLPAFKMKFFLVMPKTHQEIAVRLVSSEKTFEKVIQKTKDTEKSKVDKSKDDEKEEEIETEEL